MPREDDEERDDADDERRRRLRRRDPDDDYEDDDRRRPRRNGDDGDIAATEFLIPTGVSAASMAACYFGIFSCVIPVLGLPMALIALPCGIVALRRRKKTRSTYGSVTGDVRAILGVIASSLTLLGYLGILVFAVIVPMLK
ncbi:MAG TPA: hypothetical protein VHR66_21650 [Gemmataceae bacterium]|nr:hypothetical protein [Gemmataceae bacterium]